MGNEVKGSIIVPTMAIAMAWFWFLLFYGVEMTIPNRIFWAIGLAGITGLIMTKTEDKLVAKNASNAFLVIVVIVGVLAAFYFYNNGYYKTRQNLANLTHQSPDQNMLLAAFLGGVTAASLGTLLGTIVELFFVLNYAAKMKNYAHYQNQQQHEFAEEFKGQDADFAYDEAKFKTETQRTDPPPAPAPRGFEQRRKEDAKLWAVIDDPNATEGESLAALKAIKRRQSKAQTKPRATKQITRR